MTIEELKRKAEQGSQQTHGEAGGLRQDSPNVEAWGAGGDLATAQPFSRRYVATSALATMMGTIVLARAAVDKALSGDILEAGRRALRNQSAGRKSCRLRGKMRPIERVAGGDERS